MNLLSGRPVSLGPAKAGDGTPGGSGALPAGSPEQALFRLDLRRSLTLHRRLAAGIALAGLAGALLYLASMWPIYTAEAMVYIQPAAPRVMDQGQSMRWPFDANTYESFMQQQMQSMTRADVLAGALKKLEPGVYQKSGESEQAAAERLRHAIEVTRQGASYQVGITAHASDAGVAAKLANAVTASYMESASREEKAGDADRLAMLGEERDRVQRELAGDRAEQQALNKQLGVAAVGAAAPDGFDDDTGRVREELIKARTAHDEAAARLTTMGAGHADSSAALDADAEETVAGDAGLISLKTSLNQRRAQLTSQMANLTASNPQYKQDAQEQAQIDGSLENMMKELRARAIVRAQQRLQNDLARTSSVESQLNAQLGQMAASAGGATLKMQRASDLATDITRLQNRYSAVDDQWRNLGLEVKAPGSAHLSAAAVAPLHPFKSGPLRNTLLIALAGLFFGGVAAVGAHKSDARVYIASDVEQVLGFAPMAVLPDFLEVSDGVAEEHLLRLSAGIEYAYQQGNLKSCIFTGAGPGAGVTTVATRVRSMLETMGQGTVLVDASGTRPSQPGASAAGPSEASNRLATQRGRRSTALVRQLAEETETGEQTLVLTDTAPLAVSAETEYLARFADAAIVVVESGVTTRAQLRDVANTLQRLDVAAVGFVLNRVGLEKADPAFRLSVRAVEEHLRAQSRSLARGTERSRPAAPAAEIERESKRTVAQPQPAPERSAVAPVIPPPAPVIPELPAAGPEPESIPPRIERPDWADEAVEPVLIPASAVASRPLSQPAPRPVEPRAAAPAPPEAVVGWPEPVSAPRPVSSAESISASPLASVPGAVSAPALASAPAAPAGRAPQPALIPATVAAAQPPTVQRGQAFGSERAAAIRRAARARSAAAAGCAPPGPDLGARFRRGSGLGAGRRTASAGGDGRRTLRCGLAAERPEKSSLLAGPEEPKPGARGPGKDQGGGGIRAGRGGTGRTADLCPALRAHSDSSGSI